MIKRLVAILTALALMLAGLFTLTASPAEAAVYSCPDGGWVCFWNYQDFNYVNDGHGGIYKFDLRYFYGDCQVMPTSGASGWTNGKVYNAASSLLINNTGTNNLPGTMKLQLFDSNQCDTVHDYWFSIQFSSGSLNLNYGKLVNYGWNDRIGSFRVVNAN